jgi:tetratricopeptide (TPR) repeat protein
MIYLAYFQLFKGMSQNFFINIFSDMHYFFNLKNLLSFEGVAIIFFSLFLAYIFYHELKSFKLKFIFFPFFLGISLFVVLRDERREIIQKLTKNYEETKNISYLYKLASIYEYEGEIRDAVKTYMDIIKANPNEFAAYLRLSVILSQTGHIPLALEFAKRASEINPESMEAKHIFEVLQKILKSSQYEE